MKRILFVCTANICRSPMAAALLRQRIAAMGLAGEVEVQSAGVWATGGEPASPAAVEVLAKQGLPLGDHRSQPVTSELLEQTDLVLVMEEAHRRSLFYLAPTQLRKVFLLSEMVGRHDDVTDPYGGPVEGYVATVNLLEKLIDAGLPRILHLLEVEQPSVST